LSARNPLSPWNIRVHVSCMCVMKREKRMGDRSPPRDPNSAAAARTFSSRVAEIVLHGCKQVDPGAKIASVLRDSDGRTIVRVRASPGNDSGTPMKLLALKRLWPLANTAVVDNPLDGSVEAEITVPREEDEFKQARTKARSSRFSEFSMLLGTVMLLVGAILYAIDVHNSRFDNSTAHSEL
jgi:hypothetical protein